MTFRCLRQPYEAGATEDILGSHRLRHEVYACEQGWVRPNPEGFEQDMFDPFSTGFVAVNQVGQVVGTARAVFDSGLGFPFDSVAALPAWIRRDELYEVSRLAVSPSARAQNSLILLGLCRSMWEFAHLHGKKHWCAVADGKVTRLLATLGFEFIMQGEPVLYLGSPSIPIICSMDQSGAVLFSPSLTNLLDAGLREVCPECTGGIASTAYA